MGRLPFVYQGLPPLPPDIWGAWSWEPFILFGLILSAWAYSRGVKILWQRESARRVIQPWRVMAFAGGLATLGLALLSPLNALGRALFSAHMAQHLLLMLVAAPLLVLGNPLLPFLWAWPRPARRAIGRWWKQSRFLAIWARRLMHPLVVWLLYLITVWVWHLPALYQAALERPFVHELEHAAFLGASLLFWQLVIQPTGHRRLAYGAGILFVFTTALHSGALGALLTFATTPIYPVYTASVAAWNLTILQDQQLAGLIMWLPAGLVYLATALILFSRWLSSIEQKLAAREKRSPAVT